MLSDQDKILLDRLSVVDIINHIGIAKLLSYVDPIHAIIIWGWRTTFEALERYENHKSD